jgi:hypothetical protein
LLQTKVTKFASKNINQFAAIAVIEFRFKTEEGHSNQVSLKNN